MATRKPKDLSSSSGDFAAMLSDWESSNPQAWDAQREAKKASPKDADGTLAGQLRERFGVQGPNRQTRRQANAPAGSTARGSTVPSPHAGSSNAGQKPEAASSTAPVAGKRQVTADELMREAFEAVGVDAHDATAKYTGQGYAKALDVEVIDEAAAGVVDEAKERFDALDGHTGEDIEFLQLMATAEVTPLDRSLDKLRTALDSRTKWQREPAILSPSSAERSQDELDAPELNGAQRDLLRRARKQTLVPTLNLRHHRKQEAMNMLAAFVLKEQQNRTRFVRIITGKGKQSEGPVVLKPMVIEWCELEPGVSMVLGFAPETDQSGNYGMMILELRRS